jgi:hypothetical protein
LKGRDSHERAGLAAVVFLMFLGIVVTVARVAAYDWDWRCAIAQCRIEK